MVAVVEIEMLYPDLLHTLCLSESAGDVVLCALFPGIGEYLAARKGLLPILGVLLVVLNWIFQWVIPNLWITQTDVLLHLGVVVAIIGLLLARAL